MKNFFLSFYSDKDKRAICKEQLTHASRLVHTDQEIAMLVESPKNVSCAIDYDKLKKLI